MVTAPRFPKVSEKILLYLNAIDDHQGKASRMDFLRIAGNGMILNDWIQYLVDCNIIEAIQIENRKYFVKTESGQKLHDLLEIVPYLGPLFEDLGRDRRRRAEYYVLNPSYQ